MEALREVSNQVGAQERRPEKETQVYQAMRVLLSDSSILQVVSMDQTGIRVLMSGYKVSVEDGVIRTSEELSQVLAPFVAHFSGDVALFLQEAALAAEVAVKRHDMFRFVEREFSPLVISSEAASMDTEQLDLQVGDLNLALRWSIACDARGQCRQSLELVPSSTRANEMLRLPGAEALHDMSGKFRILAAQFGYQNAVALVLTKFSE